MTFNVIVDGYGISVRGKGSTRYTISLLQEFAKQAPDWHFRILLNANNSHPSLPDAENLEYHEFSAGPRLWWCLYTLPRVARTMPCDGLFLPGETPLWSLPFPYVMTMLEVPSIVYEASGRPLLPLRTRVGKKLKNFFLPRAVHNAEMVLAISNQTARDVAQVYEVPRERIRVTYCGCTDSFEPLDEGKKQAIRTGLGFNQGYVLMFSSGDPRERTDVMLAAYGAIANEVPQGLIVAGCNDSEQSNLRSRLMKLGIEKRVSLLPYVNDNELTQLYAAADIYLELSMYEGFGLQVCEAMASGVPVIASDCSSIPEVVGPAGILVDPGDTKAVAHALKSLLLNPEKRTIFSKRAVTRAAQFTWRHTASVTLQALEDVFCSNVKRT